MHWRLQTQQIAGKHQLSNVHQSSNDIKLFAKNEKELETLKHAVRIYNQDIGIEFGIEKGAALEMKSGKRHLIDGMELPNQEKIRTLREKETN